MDVIEACGADPSWLCRRVFDWTDNESLASLSDWIVATPLSVLLIVVLAFVARRLAHRAIDSLVERLVHETEDTEDVVAERARNQRLRLTTDALARKIDEMHDRAERSRQRARTLGVLFKSVATAVILTIAILMLLGEFDVNLGPLIAGAGIIGIAIGFGSQRLVQDVLSGIFMIVEDQYGVGDIVDVGEASGTVESVGLRTTRIRDVEGTLWHIPNGEIHRVGNKSQLWARTILDVDVAYDTDLAAASAVIKATADELWRENLEEATILEEPQVWGVQAFGADAVSIRLAVRTDPAEQWAVARRLRAMIKVAFDEAGIEIPFPQRTVWLRHGADADGAGDPVPDDGDRAEGVRPGP